MEKEKFCKLVKREKMSFGSEEEACKFIWNNIDEPETTSAIPYYCESCNCWHITSINTVKCRLAEEIKIPTVMVDDETSKRIQSAVLEQSAKSIGKKINREISVVEQGLGKNQHKICPISTLNKYAEMIDNTEKKMNSIFSKIDSKINGSKRVMKRCTKRLNNIKNKIAEGMEFRRKVG